MTESSSRSCPGCGAPSTPGIPGYSCATCFGASLFPAADESLPWAEIGGYEILEETGRGGMGVVYRARQMAINRTVALKLILTGPLASQMERQRFIAEASAAAALNHAGIVQVFEAGEEDGQLFFAMQFIEGESLSVRLGKGRLEPRAAAELLLQTALAVQHAHERGFLHRDLKPANILLDHAGAPHITDFGLARRLDDESRLTLTGAALGTPGYMAPEQTDTRQQPTTAVDVYSLGAILYEALSGRPPFVEPSLPALLVAIREKEPPPLRSLCPEIDGDLAVICHNCLMKEPGRRYRSAQALAEDLQHWLNGEPILARPAGPLERFFRWCRRRPAIASLTAAAAVLFLGGTTGILWQWRRANDNAVREAEARLDAESKAQAARKALYAADMNLCQAALRANNLGRARRLLDAHRPAPGEEDLRGWEWRYLWTQCRSGAIVEITSKGRGLKGVASNKEGSSIVANDEDGRMAIYDVGERRELTSWRKHYDQGPLTVSPDGRYFVAPVTKSFCEVWDFSGKVIQKLPLTQSLSRAAFSPDGKFIATQSKDGTVRVWSRSGEQIANIALPPLRANHAGGLTFVPGTGQLAVATLDRIQLYRSQDWTVEREWEAHLFLNISALAASPDGRCIASGTCYADPIVRVWDVSSGSQVAILEGHTAWVSTLLFSSDGSRLFSAGADQVICEWETVNWSLQGTLRGHTDEVWSLAPCGNGLISGAKNGEIKVWPGDLASRAGGLFRPYGNTVALLDAGDSGDLVELEDDTVRKLTPGTWKYGPRHPLPKGNVHWHVKGIVCVRTESGKVDVMDVAADPPALLARLAMPAFDKVGCGKGRRWLMFAHTRENSITMLDTVSRVSQRVAVPQEMRLAWMDSGASRPVVWTRSRQSPDYLIQRYDPETARWLPEESCRGISGAPLTDEPLKWMVLAEQKKVVIARAHPFEELAGFQQENNAPCAAFSPGSRWLAVANEGAWARLWRLPESGPLEEPLILRGHLNAIFSVAFTPDGSRLATLSSNREAAKLWDPETGMEMLTLAGNGTMLKQSRFSGTGECLIATHPGAGYSWQVWYAPSLETISRISSGGW